MKILLGAAVSAVVSLGVAFSQSDDLASGFEGAVRACELWILEPSSWADGPDSFISQVGLGNKMGLVQSVSDVNLPSPSLRIANYFWKINSTFDAGYVLVVSDRLPFCHITGGGSRDLQPIVEAVLTSDGFTRRWREITQSSHDGVVTTEYQHHSEPSLSIVISHASQSGQQLDRVQVIATAQFRISK